MGPEYVQIIAEKVKIIKEKLKIVQDRQKNYADRRRRNLEFDVGIEFFCNCLYGKVLSDLVNEVN